MPLKYRKEVEAAPATDWQRLHGAGRVGSRINATRHNVQFGGGHARVRKGFKVELAWHPHFIHLVKRGRPALRQAVSLEHGEAHSSAAMRIACAIVRVHIVAIPQHRRVEANIDGVAGVPAQHGLPAPHQVQRQLGQQLRIHGVRLK